MSAQPSDHQNYKSEERKFSPCSFFDQAKFWLDNMYPHWMEALTDHFGQWPSICVPDSLDVGPNKFFGPTKPAAGFDKNQVKRAKPQLRGEKGEETFFTEFRRLILGGMLINGFYTQDFIKVLSDSGVSGFNQELIQTMKHAKKHFECDFIFIHQQIGIIIVEVKGCDREQEVLGNYKEAAVQLNRAIFGLKDLYQRLCSDNTNCPLDVRGIVCMPCFDITTSSNPNKKAKLEEEYSFPLIDKSLLLDANKFQPFWHTIANQSVEFGNELIKFIVAIFAYRPAKFMSVTSNAMEIYRRIEQQNFKTAKMQGQRIIFYNEEQLKAIECDDQRVLICGPPGTGKTLCLLQRVLNAANKEKPGRVILALPYATPLAAKFEKFCIENQSIEMRRIPEVRSIFDISDYSADDDLFCDETNIGNGKLERALATRELNSGSTTVAITGFLLPHAVANVAATREIFADFQQFELKTVVRGTKTIIDEWKIYFPDRFLHIGHNITGTTTERHIVFPNNGDLTELLETIHSKISSLLSPLPAIEASCSRRIPDDQCQLNQCEPCDIAVLTLFAFDSEIRDYLNATGIRSGSIVEQVSDPTLIAVSRVEDSVSYEWAVVIIIDAVDDEWYEPQSDHHLLATSRAIAKLIYIDVPKEDS